MKKIGVIGAGSWGTALAQTLAKKGHTVKIWDISEEHLREMEEKRENTRYLPGITLSPNLYIAYSIEETLSEAEVVLFSVPAQFFRGAVKNAMPYMNKGVLIVNVAKGIEQKTLKRMSEIAEEVLSEEQMARYVVLSGPSHAEEVGLHLPTTVTVAAKDIAVAEEAQDIFITERFRVYTGKDIVGIELGGSIKNIIALGAGISDGMGFGDNAKAALMTRGIAEMKRLGAAFGADPATFSGLSGVGDLIVTCTSMHSRNRRCGILIGQGVTPTEAVKEIGMVVEGMYTTEAAYELAHRAGVDAPITDCIYKMIKGDITAEEAVSMLMSRDKRAED